VYDKGGCVLDCKCKDDHYEYDKAARDCKPAKDKCHMKGKELSDEGILSSLWINIC